MLSSLVLLFSTILLGSSQASNVPAYLLCADNGLAADVTVYYLQPLMSSTSNPINPNSPPSINYNPKTSIMVFNMTTKQVLDGELAFFVENDRNNIPMISTYTTAMTDFMTLNMTDFSVKVNGSIKDTYAYMFDPFTYVSSVDEYWAFDVDNVYDSVNASANAVVSFYADPINSDKAVFTTQWSIDSPAAEYGATDLTADSANKILYLSLNKYASDDSQGSGKLLTYDIEQQKIISDVDCGSDMLVKYSASRKALFGATISHLTVNSFFVQVTSIVEIDPSTCKTRVLIANTSLPQIYGSDLFNAFRDETGEWHFAWKMTSSGQQDSMFFSINIDSKKATEVVTLKHDTARVTLAGIVSQYSASAADKKEISSMHVLNKLVAE